MAAAEHHPQQPEDRKTFKEWWGTVRATWRVTAPRWRKVWKTAPVWVPVVGALFYWGVRITLEVIYFVMVRV